MAKGWTQGLLHPEGRLTLLTQWNREGEFIPHNTISFFNASYSFLKILFVDGGDDEEEDDEDT